MMLYEALNIDVNDKVKVIALVGGGGKTTTMFKLASELRNRGKRVLITTTTAIYEPSRRQYDELHLWESKSLGQKFISKHEAGIIVIGREVNQEGKLIGVAPEVIDELSKQESFDIILVEADGSKRRPIKAPAEHEPVIPKSATDVIGVIGMEALGKNISEESVHRPELFRKIVGAEMQAIINVDMLISLVLDSKGLFKGTPIEANKYLLLNKMDLLAEEELRRLAHKLKVLDKDLKEVIMVSYMRGSCLKWRDLID